jgi:hypothetical protein
MVGEGMSFGDVCRYPSVSCLKWGEEGDEGIYFILLTAFHRK